MSGCCVSLSVGTGSVCGMEESMGCLVGCPVVELGIVGPCSVHQHELCTTQGN